MKMKLSINFSSSVNIDSLPGGLVFMSRGEPGAADERLDKPEEENERGWREKSLQE